MRLFIVAIMIVVISSTLCYSQDDIPKLFGAEWGDGVTSLKNVMTSSVKNFNSFKYYPINAGATENSDLKNLPALKYTFKGEPFFGVPADIILTFFNSNSSLQGLELSKIEVYMSSRDTKNIQIDSRSVFKDFIRLFCEKYRIHLNADLERNIFTNYNYIVTVNGVTVNFMANSGDLRLDKMNSIFISYENNALRNSILKRELELVKIREQGGNPSVDKSNIDIKSQL